MPITTDELPATVVQTILDVVIEEARAKRVGRDLVEVDNNIKAGSRKVTYYKFTGVDEDTVVEVAEGSEFPLANVSFAEDYYNIFKIGLGLYLSRELVRTRAIKDMAAIARDTSLAVALKEDTLIMTGLVNGAGQSYAASATWSSTGDPYDDVSAAMTKLENYNYTPNALVLHPNEVGDLRKIDADTRRTYREMIEEDLGIKIFKTPKLTTGTGLLIELKKPACVGVEEDISIEPFDYIKKNQTYYSNVFESIGLKVWRPNAVCKLTGI